MTWRRKRKRRLKEKRQVRLWRIRTCIDLDLKAKRKAYLSNRAALQEKKARAEKKAEKKAEAENEQATNSSNDLLGLFTDPEVSHLAHMYSLKCLNPRARTNR